MHRAQACQIERPVLAGFLSIGAARLWRKPSCPVLGTRAHPEVAEALGAAGSRCLHRWSVFDQETLCGSRIAADDRHDLHNRHRAWPDSDRCDLCDEDFDEILEIRSLLPCLVWPNFVIVMPTRFRAPLWRSSALQSPLGDFGHASSNDLKYDNSRSNSRYVPSKLPSRSIKSTTALATGEDSRASRAAFRRFFLKTLSKDDHSSALHMAVPRI